MLLVQPALRRRILRLLRLIKPHHSIHQLQRLACAAPELLLPPQRQLGRLLRISIAAYAAEELRRPPLQLLAFLIFIQRLTLQPLLQALVELRMEQLAEDFAAFICIRIEKFAELSLRNHGDLRKLLIIQSQQLLHRPVHLARFRHRLTRIGIAQLCRRTLQRQAAAALGRTQILGVTPHDILLPTQAEGKLHERRHIGSRILAAQHRSLTRTAARLAVQRVAQRIKDNRLACTRIACNQVQPLLPQTRKIYLRPAGIRAEGTQHQL